MGDIRLLTYEDGYGMSNFALPPNNEILLDNAGKPSVMVKIPFMRTEGFGLSSGIHPAFMVNNDIKRCIYISKYQNVVENNRAYSLPDQIPASGVSYDEAIAFCENKGPGWHLMTNAEWTALALWCRMMNCMPYGSNNSNSGNDYYHTSDYGIISDGTLKLIHTGSGAKDWFHNNDYSGIADFNGNVDEWVGGLRVVNGEIQVIPYNNAAAQVDQSSGSSEWKCLLPNNNFSTPGTTGSAKYTLLNGKLHINNTNSLTGTQSGYFKEITRDNTTTGTCYTLDELAFVPDNDIETYRNDFVVVNLTGERYPTRGGNCASGNYAGIFNLMLDKERTSKTATNGFRCAYIPE